MKYITIANRKGGTGKTTITYNLGFYYALQKRKVLFIDLDSQGNLTDLAKAPLLSVEDFKSCKVHTVNDYIDILPASKSFQILENEIHNEIERNLYLKNEVLKKVSGYDYILVDTSPSLSILNINAFCMSDYIYIIIQADNFSLNGLNEMAQIIDKILKINPKLKYKIVLNGSFKNRVFTDKVKERLSKVTNFSGIEIPHRQYIIDSNALRRPSLEQEEIYKSFENIGGIA